jgi:REP element-mobilizing transposase RayT
MPENHPRRSIRLPGFDYSAPGAYFITINVRSREPLLGECTNQGVCLNDLGVIVEKTWITTTKFFPIELDEYSIMPDHFHALVWFLEHKNEPKLPVEGVQIIHGTQPRSLQALMQNFKSVTTRRINQMRKSPGMQVWQRNYYEHVTRDDRDLENIRQYIRENPYRKNP